MKVTDNEILKAVWREQLKKTAHGVIDNYVGGVKGLKDPRSQGFAQSLYMISRQQLDVPLSKGHLANRLKTLVGAAGTLQWEGRSGNAYRFTGYGADEAFSYALNWWQKQGVPGGFDVEQRSMRTARVEDFEGKVAELQAELLSVFLGPE